MGRRGGQIRGERQCPNWEHSRPAGARRRTAIEQCDRAMRCHASVQGLALPRPHSIPSVPASDARKHAVQALSVSSGSGRGETAGQRETRKQGPRDVEELLADVGTCNIRTCNVGTCKHLAGKPQVSCRCQRDHGNHESHLRPLVSSSVAPCCPHVSRTIQVSAPDVRRPRGMVEAAGRRKEPVPAVATRSGAQVPENAL